MVVFAIELPKVYAFLMEGNNPAELSKYQQKQLEEDPEAFQRMQEDAKLKAIEDRATSYMLAMFTILIAQFLYYNFLFATNLFAEQIASYQIALVKDYPKGQQTNSESFLLWSFFTSLSVPMIGLGCALNWNAEMIFAGLYTMLES
jgi:hypothetical protein